MGTSVPSERVFSVAGLTATDKRSQISSEIVDKIIFLNKALKEKYKQESVPLMPEVKVKLEPGTASETEEKDDEELPLPDLY